MMTYGDGVANIDLRRLLEFHQRHGKLATVTAVRPPARFGGLAFDGDLVRRFTEKPQIGEGWINGGFFVLETPAAPPPHASSRPPLIKIGQVLRRAAIYQPALSSGLLRVSQKLGLDEKRMYVIPLTKIVVFARKGRAEPGLLPSRCPHSS